MLNAQSVENKYHSMLKPQSWLQRRGVFCPPVVAMIGTAQAALDERFDNQVIATGDCGYRVRRKTGS
jgi:hypothetical protein